jgi:uncharacterized protein YjlB
MAIDIETYVLAPSGYVPNSTLPLVVYRGVVSPGETEGIAVAFERAFDANGWGGRWRNGVFDYHHFHDASHEVLGFAGGTGRILFGGEGGIALDVRPGDAVVIPAGVGHKRLAASEDFLVVGAYPKGQENPSILTESEFDRRQALLVIDKLEQPATDPFFGPAGPLLEIWAGRPAPVSASPLPLQTRYG